MKKPPSWPIYLSLAILSALSLLTISSTGSGLLVRQALYWGLGIFILFFSSRLNIDSLSAHPRFLIALAGIFVALPIALKLATRGTYRWIDIGLFGIQPSELIKPFLILSTARIISRSQKNSKSASETYLRLLPLAVPILITALQPDLGSALSMVFFLLFILLAGRLNLSPLLPFILLGLVLTPLAYNHLLHGYQKDRIRFFLNPQKDPLGQGYHLIQSQIAIGSGGLAGQGYKKGSQNRLSFLPERHNDFIFASLAEELGLVGVTLLLFSYLLLLVTLLKIAFCHARNNSYLFTVGAVGLIWFQSLMNIGMNLGLLPITGLPLPFVSAGGSSLLTLLFTLGLCLSTLSLDS